MISEIVDVEGREESRGANDQMRTFEFGDRELRLPLAVPIDGQWCGGIAFDVGPADGPIKHQISRKGDTSYAPFCASGGENGGPMSIDSKAGLCLCFRLVDPNPS